MKSGLKLRVGTRGSRLALAQTAIVVDLIKRATPAATLDVVQIRTAGDKVTAGSSETDRKLAFTEEIDRQLISAKVDIAVHSLKDVPSIIDPRLVIGAMPARADPRDALVALSGRRLSEVPAGSSIGTSSIRRKVQLGRLRPDLSVVDIHGNVETRIAKMKGLGLEGVVLAAAGLQRLGVTDKASQFFSTEEMVPAACQGILGVAVRRDNKEALDALRRIDDSASHVAGECERAFLEAVGGDCNFPVGAYAEVEGFKLTLTGLVAEPDGSSMARGSIGGSTSSARDLGAQLARRLLTSRGTPPR